MVMNGVVSKEHLHKCVTDNDGRISSLLVYASWNNKKIISQIHSLIENIFSDLFREGIGFKNKYHNERSMHLPMPNFCTMQADLNDDTMDFCIGENAQDSDGDMHMGGTTDPTRKIRLNCPETLPALYIISCFRGRIDIVQVQMSSREILFFSEDFARNAIEEALLSLLGRTTTNSGLGNPTRNPQSISKKRDYNLLQSAIQSQIRIFIAGDRSQVGKSSVCLGILGTLLRLNYPASSLAYIKPATQCEQAQLVSEYCKEKGIDACPVGPIVYYRGFTRAYLNNETESSESLLQKVTLEVDKIAKDKSVVVIDGVGYPAVGSITNTDNAKVARASGYPTNNEDGGPRRPAAVLIVGKSGVGDAVDSYNLNATYFRSQHVPVLGAVFNRLPLDGYYSIANCKRAVSTYFEQNLNLHGHEKVFGFIPEVEHIAHTRMECEDANEKRKALELAITHAEDFITVFSQYVNVEYILERAANIRDNYHEPYVNGNGSESSSKKHKLRNENNHGNSDKRAHVPLTRQQIEQSAKESGATGG
jgi:hypothetical protein